MFIVPCDAAGTRSGTAPDMRLDGNYLAPVVGGACSFNLVHVPRDCIVTLETIKSGGGVGEAVDGEEELHRDVLAERGRCLDRDAGEMG